MSTLNDSTYNRIWHLIATGRLKAGERLHESLLAEQLNVSRTPVREAINQLVQQGIVMRSPYRGNFVAALDGKAVNDLYIVRQELEGFAVCLAVPRMTDADIALCGEWVRSANDALARGDSDAYGEADRRLHEFIIEKSGNETLKSSLASLSRKIQLVRRFGNQQVRIAEEAAANRNAFLHALERRDPEAAAQLMQRHIDDVRVLVLEQLSMQAAQEQSSVAMRPPV